MTSTRAMPAAGPATMAAKGGRVRPPGPPSPLAARRERSAGGGWPWLAVRGLGALAVLAIGAVHLQQYDKLYSGIPTIGTLFVLNFAGATAVGLALLAPVERLAGRYGSAALAASTVAGIGLAATSFVFLFISERTPLFGFQEPGFDPTAIAASRAFEVAAVVLLGAFLIGRFAAGVPTRRW